jgi:hypothetical protein
MRSHEELMHPVSHRTTAGRASRAKNKPYGVRGNLTRMKTAEQALRMRLSGLIQEHRDLDGAVALLFEAGAQDPLLIARLKKRKLHLKDEIARLAATCEAALASG